MDTNSVKANPNGEGIDPNLRDFLLSIKKDIMDFTRESVERINARIDANERDIFDIKAQLAVQGEKIEERIMSKIERIATVSVQEEKIEQRILSRLKKTSVTPALQPQGATTSKREESYLLARRSLRMWPVEGYGEDLEGSVKLFIRNKLKICDSVIHKLGIIKTVVSRGRAAKERKEIVAYFETKEDRDTVKAAGINLAGQKTAGMSIYVPGHLVDNLRALNSVGYHIKNRYNGVKRSVKFDEQQWDISLDICIGGIWRRILPREARQVMKTMRSAATTSRGISAKDLTGLLQNHED